MNKKILKLSVPNIISNLSVPLVGIVDVALMGHQNDPAYVGAIGLGATVFTFIYAGLGFLRMGTSGFTAQNRGARNIRDSFLTLGRALSIAAIAGLLLIILQKPLSFLAFKFLNSSMQVETLATVYFKTRIWAAPATLGLYAITGWFIGMQNAKIPMWIMLSVNIINIAFSFLFVTVFDMQVKGVALGTVIGQYSGFIIGLILLLTHKKRILDFWSFKNIFNRRELSVFMNVNRDILIRSVLLTGSFYYFNAKSASLGENILAINSVLIQFLWFFSHFIDGFAFAAEAITGKYKGARDKSGLKKAVKYLFAWGGGVSVFITLIYAFFNKGIIAILTDQTEILKLANEYSFWVVLIPVVSFSAFVWDGIFIGTTQGKALRNAMLISTLFIFVPLINILDDLMGNNGMWLALIIFMIARAVTLFIYYPKTVLKE